MSPVLGWLGKHRWGQYVAVVWLLAATGAVAWLVADKVGEAGREAARNRATTVAFCLRTRGQAYAPLTDTSTEFPRNDVRGALFTFGLLGCEQVIGPIDPSRVSPEAFRPAPAPVVP